MADFLRRSPYVKLGLTPVVTAADVDSVATQEVVARIQAFQRERNIAEFPAAVRAYLASQGVPGPPPASVDEQIARLREREPEPTARLAELHERRLAATRDRLVRVEGLPTERLQARSGEIRREAREQGRVEFSLGAK